MKVKQLFFFFCLAFALASCNQVDDSKDVDDSGQQVSDSTSTDNGRQTLSRRERLLTFAFSANKNGFSSDLVASISEVDKVVKVETQRWINSLDSLVASYTTTGDSAVVVAVGGVVQQSGVTSNDFRENSIVYSLTVGDSVVSYTVVFVSPQFTGLPVMKIDVVGGKEITEKTENYFSANVTLIDNANPDYSFEQTSGIRGRGNLSWTYEKKPYRLKFDSKVSMFGLGAEKSWVLLANWQDPTVLSNDIAFELARRFGLEYTNHSHYVELFLNGTYRGNYQLTEQVQVGKNRINIDEDDDFLVEIDTYYDEDPKFTTSIVRLPIMVKSPEDVSVEFVRQDWQALEDALFGDANFLDSGYRDLVDVESLINYLIVNELTRNQELNHPKSTYAYKKNSVLGSKICFGPVWDFDWGFGYAEYGHTYFTKSGILFRRGGYNGEQVGSRFFNRFFDDPVFRSQYKQRWNTLKDKEIATIIQYIDVMAEKLQESQKQNYKRWSTYASCNFTSEIAKMKTWMQQRINYLDSEISKFD